MTIFDNLLKPINMEEVLLENEEKNTPFDLGKGVVTSSPTNVGPATYLLPSTCFENLLPQQMFLVEPTSFGPMVYYSERVVM